jgi:CDP-diglyceride synthetase
LYRPKLVAPSPNVALLGFVGRALGFVILSSGYFHIANQVKESCLLKNNTVKDLVFLINI